MATAQPKRKRRLWRWLLINFAVSLLLLVGLGGAILLAATCRPNWYQPIAIDESRLRTDKRELVSLLDEIGHGLNRGEPVTMTLDEAQLNRWIVARDELWPGVDVEIQGIEQPFLSLLPGGRVRLAVTTTQTPVPSVISLTAVPAVERDVLRLEVDGVRAGRLPIPTEQLLAEIAGLLPPERATLIDGVIRIRNEWIWENGRQPFRIAAIRVEGGAAEVELEPLR